MKQIEIVDQSPKDRQLPSPTFRERWSAQPWWKAATALASEIESTTELCASLALPVAEIKALWLSHFAAVKIVMEQRDAWSRDPIQMAHLDLVHDRIDGELHVAGVKFPHVRWQLIEALFDLRHVEEMRTLHGAMQGFSKAFYRRGDASAQARYTEARLSSRRALAGGPQPPVGRLS